MASTTTGLSKLMSTYYDKVFLDRAELMLVYDVAAQSKTIPMNEGKSVVWNRMSPLAVATTALTEATTPSFTDMSSTQVSATVQPYGAATKVGQLFSMTSIDEGLREHVETHGQNAGETIDTLIRDELDGGGTTLLANSVAAVTDIAASDTLDGEDVRAAVLQLKKNKALPFENNHYKAIVPVSCSHDLRGDSEWLDAYRYTQAENIRNGMIGRLHGAEFHETNNEVVSTDGGSGTVDVYTTFFVGKNAYGTVNLAGQDGARIYVKQPNDSSTDNPIDMFSTIGWKVHFATKVLNSNWVIELKSASSQGAN